MAEDRDQTIEIITATQVATASLFYDIKQESPLLAKLMMDKLKSFLTKDCYSCMERQTILMRFLEEHTDLDVIHEVLDYINNSNFKEDYTAIIMEWTYHNTDKIKKHYLAKCDGTLLCTPKINPNPMFKASKSNATDEYVNAILQIIPLIDDNGGDDDLLL